MRFDLEKRLLALPFVFATAAACTLVLPPDEDADGVQRCQNSEECRDLGDNRLEASCFTDNDQPDGADGVCIATYFDLRCDPELFPAADMHPFGEAFEDVDQNAYVGDCETAGERGCAPDAGSCAAGLEVTQVMVGDSSVTICDDPGATLKAMPGTINTAGQDVQDNFCRWYFGDNNFVCDTSVSGGARCRPCDADKDATRGGCYETWLNGARSPVYVDCAEGSSCNGGNQGTTDAVFGPPAEPLP